MFDLTSNRIDIVDRFEVRVLDGVGTEEAFLTVTDSGSGFTSLIELTAGVKTFEVEPFTEGGFPLGTCSILETVQAGDTLPVTKGVCSDDPFEPEEADGDCVLLNGVCNAFEVLYDGSVGGLQALDDDWWRLVFTVAPSSGQVRLTVTGSTPSSLEPVAVFRRAPGAATLEPLATVSTNEQTLIVPDVVPGTEIYLKFAPAPTVDPCSNDMTYGFQFGAA